MIEGNHDTRSPTCSVVILNYNGADCTIACYKSVTAQTCSDFEVIIVDNASTDGSSARISAECPQAHLLRLPDNVGTSGGFAAGADHAKSELVLFLCNDTVLDPDVLEKMVEVMKSRPDAGACGVKQVHFSKPDIVDCIGYVPDRFGFPAFTDLRKRDSGKTNTLDAWVSGTVFMVRKEVYERVGGYDSLMFTLSDEVDLCWRIRTHGFTTLVAAAARVRHHVTATLSSQPRGQTHYWSQRNIMRMLLKNYSGPTLTVILPQYLIIELMEFLYLLTQRMWGLAWADVRALGWNIARFPDTWRHHRRLQRTRTVSDRQILKGLVSHSIKLRWGRGILLRQRPGLRKHVKQRVEESRGLSNEWKRGV